MRRLLVTLLAVLAALVEASAQYDASFSHYWAMHPSFNPAAVGDGGKLSVTAAYNMTMVGFSRNPRTMYVGADMPVALGRSRHGVGLQLLNDDTGLFSHKRLGAQYALRQQLLGGVLSVGVQAGVLSETLDGSDLDLEEASDPAFTTSQATGTALDLSAGVFYRHHAGWYTGASVAHVTAPTINLGETNELEVSACYYFTAGYNIRLRNPFLTMQASVLGRSDGVARRADATARLTYRHEGRVMYAGLGYSPSNSVSLFVGGTFHGVMVGYGYEAYTSAVGPGSGGHELYVGYQTDVNLGKKGRNRHQSVRIL